MSNSDELKRDGPPTLFGASEDKGAGPDTRILASLEGRVPAHGNAKPAAPRRHGVFAAVALLLLACGAGAVWLKKSGEGEATVAAVKPSAGAASAPVAAAPAQAGGQVSVANEEAAPQSATIVDAAPAPNADDRALDQLGKVGDSVALATAAGGAALMAHAATREPALANRDTIHSPFANLDGGVNKKKEKTELSNTKSASKSSSAASASSGNAAKKATDRVRTERTQLAKASRPAKKSGKSGSLHADDPDADLLAALLAPQPGAKAVSAPRSRGKASTTSTTSTTGTTSAANTASRTE